MTKPRALVLVLIIVAPSFLGNVLMQPFVLYRLSTKAFTFYEIYLLKYPISKFIQSEIMATSKVSMATHYTFYSPDEVGTVLAHMGKQGGEYIQLRGSHVIAEPTFRSTTCANKTRFKGIF